MHIGIGIWIGSIDIEKRIEFFGLQEELIIIATMIDEGIL